MNNWMLPFLALLGAKQGGNAAGVPEAMLTSSSQIPEGTRTLFAVTQAIDQSKRQEEQKTAVAKRETELADLFVTDKVIVEVGTDLSTHPRMEFMLSKLSTEKREEVSGKLTNKSKMD